MNVASAPRFPAPDRVQTILKEVQQAREAIENAPAADCFESDNGRTLAKPQGDYVGGQITQVPWMKAPDKITATSRQGDVTVQLRSETFKKDTSAMEAAAAGVGSIFGAVLGAALGSDEGKGSLVAGAILGGLAAWGGIKKTIEGPGESRIERVETTPTGITTEKVVLGPDGESTSYSKVFHRIGAPPEFDAQAAKDFIQSIDLGPAPKN